MLARASWPRGSPLILLSVQKRCSVNTELEPSPDTLDESLKVVNFAGAAPESTLDDKSGAHPAEELRRQPRSEWISAPHMLGIEGSIAETIHSEQSRPVFALATAIVAHDHLGPQKYYGIP